MLFRSKAAGFAVLEDQIHTLEERLCESCSALKEVSKDKEPVWLDAEVKLEDLSPKLFSDVLKMAPFGVGNPKPLFKIRDVTPTSVRLFGKQKNHLEISFPGNKAIGFFMTEDSFDVRPEVGKKINLLANLEESFFAGRKERRLRIVDVV